MKTFKATPVLYDTKPLTRSAVFKSKDLLAARKWCDKNLKHYHPYWSLRII